MGTYAAGSARSTSCKYACVGLTLSCIGFICIASLVFALHHLTRMVLDSRGGGCRFGLSCIACDHQRTELWLESCEGGVYGFRVDAFLQFSLL